LKETTKTANLFKSLNMKQCKIRDILSYRKCFISWQQRAEKEEEKKKIIKLKKKKKNPAPPKRNHPQNTKL